jgi:hypothetical protein
MAESTPKYRVWYVINPPNYPNYVNVIGLEEESKSSGLKSSTSWHCTGYGVVYELSNGEFTEWIDDNGKDINEAFDIK